jgi:hypothetical protein
MPGAGEDGLCVPSIFFFRFLLLPFASAPAFFAERTRVAGFAFGITSPLPDREIESSRVELS